MAHIHSTEPTTSALDLTTRGRRPDETDALGDAIAELAARIQAATYELLVMIRQFDERGGWGQGFTSCAHWLNWRTGLAMGAAREKVRVARALADLPRLSDAMRRGHRGHATWPGRQRPRCRAQNPHHSARNPTGAVHTRPALLLSGVRVPLLRCASRAALGRWRRNTARQSRPAVSTASSGGARRGIRGRTATEPRGEVHPPSRLAAGGRALGTDVDRCTPRADRRASGGGWHRN